MSHTDIFLLSKFCDGWNKHCDLWVVWINAYHAEREITLLKIFESDSSKWCLLTEHLHEYGLEGAF